MGLLGRLRNTFRPRQLDRDLDEELEFHRQMCLRKARDEGVVEEEAQRAASRRMGNLPLAKDEMRDARVTGWLASALQDMRHGVALLGRDPGLSALMILVLALGIGGNAAIFTLAKAAFLDPLPHRDAGRLVTVVESNGWTASVSEFLDIREHTRTIEAIAFAEHRDMQVSGTAEPMRVYASRATASWFPLLGAQPVLGRGFVEQDNQPGRSPVVLLSYDFWRSRMGGDAGVVGRSLRLDGQPAEVVGVLPESFHFDYPTLRIAEPVEIYVAYPLASDLPRYASSRGLGVPVRVVARLRGGVTIKQAEADLERISRIIESEKPLDPDRPRGFDPRAFHLIPVPLRDAIVGTERSLLWLLLTGAGILLLIACANTAQLLLARSLRRGREIAIRSALGASRLRLVRQFLIEGLVLAACGGAAGLVVSGAIARGLVAMLPVRSPLLEAARVDAEAVGFAAAVSLVSVLLFGVIPAVKGSRWTPGPALSARTVTGEGNRWRHVMVAIEAALSVVLLCGAGLVAQNLWALVESPMGFDPDHVMVMQLKLPAREQNSIEVQAGEALRDYLEKVRAIPGVDSAATVTGLPLHPVRGGPTRLIGVNDKSGDAVLVLNHLVSTDYFRTLRIPVIAGRVHRADDVVDRPWVAVVSQEFARQFGLGLDVIGKQFDEPVHQITIVGVVGDVRTRSLDTRPMPEVYLSAMQLSWANVYLVVRSSLPPEQLVPQVRSVVESVNPDQAVFGVVTMDEFIAEHISQPRFHAFLIGAFALLAVMMAAAGMYSVISCLVAQRTSEIAIRVALGASRGAIVWTVLGSTTLWVAAGLAGGLGLGLAASDTIRTWSSSTVDAAPAMYAGVVVLFLAVTLVAAWLPVRRANRVDPAAALRCE